jgi:lipoate-protein ligase A
MKFNRLELILDQEPFEANWNMAIDEALLFTAELPTLRCYRWSRPAVSFGYFVKWETVAAQYPERQLVRRWTGGGVVEHGEDFTYSLVIPIAVDHPKTNDLYRFVHFGIACALRQGGQTVEIIGSPDQVEAVRCFDRAVESDLKANGKKIAGAAVRHHRRGVLLQGSIQRVMIPATFGTMLAETFTDQITTRPLSVLTKELASRLANEKYGSEVWNRRF